MVDLQVNFNFPRHRTKLPLVLNQNILIGAFSSSSKTEEVCHEQYEEGNYLVIMTVPTGKLNICKQKMVLLIAGVGAKDQPGWTILE